MAIIHLNKDNFNETVAGAGVIAAVDFWATWCGPCKMLAPVLEGVAGKAEGKAVIGKVDVDEQMELAQKFGVMNIPTIVFFRDGQEVDRIVGLCSETAIMEKLGL